MSTVTAAAVVFATSPGSGEASATSPTGRQSAVARVRIPNFSHVVLVVLENKEYGEVMGNRAAPAFGALARRYALLTDYRAVAHPSLPNYLALVSGSTHGITSDCTTCEVDARNLADTLGRAGKSWKTYAEGLPYPGFAGASAGRYAKKHDPFVYFKDVADNPIRMRHVVPLPAFRSDLRARRLPDFSLVVPDLCHDMHDCPVATGDRWLSSFLKPLLSGPALAGGVVFVVFDEGTSSAGGGGRVPALVLGPRVRPRSRVATSLNHYSLLRTIEESWHLPQLEQSATAAPIVGIWRGAGRATA
jgi:hypothetical protein